MCGVCERNKFRAIKVYASLNFSMFEIKYCPRSCNKVADALAAYGANLGQNSVVIWPKGAPEFVNGLIASDFAVLSK